MRIAVVNSGTVDNVLEWDGHSTWTPPAGVLVEVEPGEIVGPGWQYDQASEPRFSPPQE